MTDTIARIEAWRCPLPMGRELRLGPITYLTRDYVVMRITTSDGVTGTAIGYTRNTPLLDAVAALTPHLARLDPSDPLAVATMLKARFAPGWGAVVRAASLIDIALWDISAKTRHVPLSTLLSEDLDETSSRQDHDVPLMVVAGYFADERGTGAIVDEVRRFLDEGYETIKLLVRGDDREADVDLVSRITDVLPEGVGLAIDFHGAFTDVATATAYAEAFADVGLRFIEDAFPSYETDLVTELAARVPTPIASGEDLITTSSYRQLLTGGVGVLRTDATATGGVTAVLEGVGSARAHGATVAPHVWPHVHMPFAEASSAVTAIEVIPHYSSADPIDLLLAEPFPIRAGRWHAPETDGLYLPLDWDKVRKSADASWSAGV